MVHGVDVLKHALASLPALAVRSVTLAKRAFATRLDAFAWLAAAGLGGAEVHDEPGAWRADIRSPSAFVRGSDRRITVDGAVVMVGLLVDAVAKNVNDVDGTVAALTLRLAAGRTRDPLNRREASTESGPNYMPGGAWRGAKR